MSASGSWCPGQHRSRKENAEQERVTLKGVYCIVHELQVNVYITETRTAGPSARTTGFLTWQTGRPREAKTKHGKKKTHVYQRHRQVGEVVDPRHAGEERHERQGQPVPSILRHPPLVRREPHRHPRRKAAQQRHPPVRERPDNAGAPQAERPDNQGGRQRRANLERWGSTYMRSAYIYVHGSGRDKRKSSVRRDGCGRGWWREKEEEGHAGRARLYKRQNTRANGRGEYTKIHRPLLCRA